MVGETVFESEALEPVDIVTVGDSDLLGVMLPTRLCDLVGLTLCELEMVGLADVVEEGVSVGDAVIEGEAPFESVRVADPLFDGVNDKVDEGDGVSVGVAVMLAVAPVLCVVLGVGVGEWLTEAVEVFEIVGDTLDESDTLEPMDIDGVGVREMVAETLAAWLSDLVGLAECELEMVGLADVVEEGVSVGDAVTDGDAPFESVDVGDPLIEGVCDTVLDGVGVSVGVAVMLAVAPVL